MLTLDLCVLRCGCVCVGVGLDKRADRRGRVSNPHQAATHSTPSRLTPNHQLGQQPPPPLSSDSDCCDRELSRRLPPAPPKRHAHPPTCLNTSGSCASIFLAALAWPNMGSAFLMWPMMSRWILKARTRLTNSFTCAAPHTAAPHTCHAKCACHAARPASRVQGRERITGQGHRIGLLQPKAC